MKVSAALSFLLCTEFLNAFTFLHTPRGGRTPIQTSTRRCNFNTAGFGGINTGCQFARGDTSFHSRQTNTRPSSRIILFAADFYATLGVDKSADLAEIKSAYRKMARKYHPDANHDSTEDTNAKMQEVNRAYEVLKNEDMRKRYDMYGEAGIGTSAASEGGMRGNPFGGAGFSQEVDLGDIFESFFGGSAGMGGRGAASGFGGARTRTRGPAVGDDLRFDLEIDFKTAVFGGDEKVRVRHLETCETCDGDGVQPGSQVRTCAECQGQGVTMQVTRTPLGNFQSQQVCSTCRGTGQQVDQYCGVCSGNGLSQKTKQIKVTIPAGVEDGNKLRVRGEGDAGPNGGPAGDLYIFLRVREDKQFRREGPDIYSDASISYIDAILGASMKVPVVDGEVSIKVPPGTQPGQVMRLRGNGAPNLGNPSQRGDHYVTLNVEIPKSVTKKEEELMKELRELQSSNFKFFE